MKEGTSGSTNHKIFKKHRQTWKITKQKKTKDIFVYILIKRWRKEPLGQNKSKYYKYNSLNDGILSRRSNHYTFWIHMASGSRNNIEEEDEEEEEEEAEEEEAEDEEDDEWEDEHVIHHTHCQVICG